MKNISKMIIIVSSLLIFTANAQDPKEETTVAVAEVSSSTPAEEPIVLELSSDTTEEEVVLDVNEPSSSGRVDDLHYIDLARNYIANKKIKNAEEVLWEMTDYDYKNIKNNDFQYAKIKDEKKKEYKGVLDNSEVLLPTLNVSVVVGKYDFTKNIWPITDVQNSRSGYLTSYSQSLYTSTLEFFPNGIEGKVAETNKLPATFYLKVSDIKNLKTLKMNKETAEKVSNQLGSGRTVACTLKLANPKMEEKKVKSYAPGQTTKLEATYSFSADKLKCFEDDLRTKEITLN